MTENHSPSSPLRPDRALILFAALLALPLVAAAARAGESNPARATTGEISNPGDLLKEADGREFRFSYFPSWNRLRLLVLRPPQQFTKWEVLLRWRARRTC